MINRFSSLSQMLEGQINRLSSVDPEFWVTLEYVLLQKNNKGISSADWPDSCFLPMSLYRELLSEESNIFTEVGKNILAMYYRYCGWRYTKGIYEVPEPLRSELLKSTISDEIPLSFVENLPEWAAFISLSSVVDGKVVPMELTPNVHTFGFFPMVEVGTNTPMLTLAFAIQESDDIAETVVIIEPDKDGNLSISSSVEDLKKQLYEMGVSGEGDQEIVRAIFNPEFVRSVLSLLLYICENAFKENGARQYTYPTAKKTKKGNRIFAAPKARTWVIGKELSDHLERSLQAAKNGQGGASTVSPHIRRSHWHTFWAGARDAEVRERRVKWLPPIPVAFENEETDFI